MLAQCLLSYFIIANCLVVVKHSFRIACRLNTFAFFFRSARRKIRHATDAALMPERYRFYQTPLYPVGIKQTGRCLTMMYQREISLPAELYRRPVENLPPMPPPVRRRKRSRVRRRRKLARFLATCCAMMAVCVLLANAFAAGPEEKAPEPALPRTAPIVPITAEEPIIKDPVDPEAWNLILVNPWNPLPENYSFTKKELSNGHAVDERCYPDLQAMMDACRAAGNSPVICSSYRSYEKQQSLYQNKVNRLAAQGYSQEKAREEAAKAVALPGTSEHQLGLAVDIVDIANQNLDSSQ